MVDFANESRANRELYWRKDGQRNSLNNKVDGRDLPQLKRDPNHPDDPDRFIAASDAPPPVQPDYMPAETHPVVRRGRNVGIEEHHLAHLDAATTDREWTLAADRITRAAKEEAEADHGRDSEEFKRAKAIYADTHDAVGKGGEAHGEYAAHHHAMASEHPEYELVDVPHTGSGSDQFDQIYEHRDRPGHYIVVEAKAPAADLQPRKGHSGRRVMQGTREYFETIIIAMQEGTPEQEDIANKLEEAYAEGNVQYVKVQSRVEDDTPDADPESSGESPEGSSGDEGAPGAKRYGGFAMKYFDIRKPEEGQA
ncbi:hypothetical protein ACWDZ4_14995 [Streptomyces sp. NPDC003016]